MGRDLDSRDVLVVGEEEHLAGGGDVEDVDALTVFVGQSDEALRGAQRRFRVAPDGVAGRVTGNPAGLALFEPKLILGMKARAA